MGAAAVVREEEICKMCSEFGDMVSDDVVSDKAEADKDERSEHSAAERSG